MDYLRKKIQKYSGFFRSIKFFYRINNWFNRRLLSHNKSLYKKHGIKKSIYDSLSSTDFKNLSSDIPWLDRQDAIEDVKSHSSFESFSASTQDSIIQFIEDGFMILPAFFSKDAIQKHNEIFDDLLSSGNIDFNYTKRKITEAYKQSEFIDRHFFKNKDLLKLLEFIMGKKIIPFHTIHFLEGSEQKAHSDSIHMTTEPRGYLIAVWVALEDIDQDNGPLFYYPKSHRMDYLMSTDYDTGNTKWQLGKDNYRNYESKVQEILDKKSLDKKYFHAKAGDLLIWHANLLHGGEKIKEAGRTRRSMVAHYFCEEVICYHEISQRPALLPGH